MGTGNAVDCSVLAGPVLKKKGGEVPFAYHQSLPKIAENPAPEWPSAFPGKHESVERPSAVGHPASQCDGFH